MSKTKKSKEYVALSTMDAANADIERFLQTVSNIMQHIRSLGDTITEMDDIHNDQLMSGGRSQEVKKNLDRLHDTVSSKNRVILGQLKELKQVADKCQETAQTKKHIMQNQIFNVKQEYTKQINRYNESKDTFTNKTKAQIKRQLEIAGREVPDEQLDGLVESGTINVFSYSSSQKMLEDAQSRHNDMAQLARSIIEVHELFLQVANLVEDQGDIVDRIEDNIEKAQIKTTIAREQLQQTEELNKRCTKKRCCCISIVIIVVVVATLVLTIYFLATKKSG